MKRIDNDTFYEYIKQYDPNSDQHMVGEVDYHLLCDDEPYMGINSHREALRSVFDWLAKQSIKDEENTQLTLVYDIDKAIPSPLDPQKFFYCPNIVKIDYYGNVFYDARWEPNDENFGTTVP
ncbi:MAG: hypothetical protein J6S49_02525, partial [Erysipelotrichaceae bacterium]|nr:hypothetical protein [Erysipelotrichaceae bacterium]